MMQCLKRKNSDSVTEDSDYEENLPSVKRQRISMGAMQRLFAAFNINDSDDDDTKLQKNRPKPCDNKFRLFGTNNKATVNNNVGSVPDKNNSFSMEAFQSTKLKPDKSVFGNKREAELSDNEDTDKPKTKKVRHLKRGLKLCSNITCYIEQILYN